MDSSPEFQRFLEPSNNQMLEFKICIWFRQGLTIRRVCANALPTRILLRENLVMLEKEKAKVTEMVGKITYLCWDKCITSSPGSNFSSSEASCLSNCAQRYTDMSIIIMERFQTMQ